jgi:hypothetical protein
VTLPRNLARACLIALLTVLSCHDPAGIDRAVDISGAWQLTATFTAYQHDNGPTGSCPEHCGIREPLTGPTLTGVLHIAPPGTTKGSTTTFTHVSGTFLGRTCDVIGAGGTCAQLSPEKSIAFPSGTVTLDPDYPAAGSIYVVISGKVGTELFYPDLALTDVTFAGDSLSGSAFWALQAVGLAITPAYVGTFVAHRVN